MRVLRTVGVEGEMELPFAALQQLCSPILELSEGLPGPQRDALSVAFGLSAGRLRTRSWSGWRRSACSQKPRAAAAPVCRGRFAWLDRASARALAFVARRLFAEKIAFVFTARELGEAFAGLPELRVEPLGRRDARALLESVLPARLDEHVLDRIVLETHGNPLALLELPRGLTPIQLAGGFGLPVAVPLSTSIEESFTRRLARLGGDARRLLLIAAADPTGDPALVWRAAQELESRSPCRERRSGRAVGARSPRGFPSSARSLRRLSGGQACRATGRTPSPGAGNRSRGRS